MREEFLRWANEYPSEFHTGNDTFKASPVAKLVTRVVPRAIEKAIPSITTRFHVEGSAGQSKWTHTSWIAILDLAITSTVQDGYYVVYLLDADGKNIFLSINQGCTTLKNAVGVVAARKELVRRASLMRERAHPVNTEFSSKPILLQSTLWRAQLYGAGNIWSRTYDTSSLPPESELVLDLEDALRTYRAIRNGGGWAAEDEMLKDLAEEQLPGDLEEAKRYRLHRTIERQSGNARKVKKILGYQCMGCDQLLSTVYGTIAKELIHAHHLEPLGKLKEGEKVKLDARKDFAVLCPNCHAVIHRLDDASDLTGLRRLIALQRSKSLD